MCRSWPARACAAGCAVAAGPIIGDCHDDDHRHYDDCPGQLLLLPQLEQLLSVKYSPAPMHQIWGFGLQMQGKHLGIRNDLG